LKKYLFLNVAAQGHVNPTLPVVSELVAWGAHVTYVLPETFREAVEAAGGVLAPLALSLRSGTDVPDDQTLTLLPFEFGCSAKDAVPKLVELIRQTSPDCIVHNSLYLWGRLAARITGIPAASFRPYHAPRAPRPVLAPFASAAAAGLAAAAEAALGALCQMYRQPAVTLHELVHADEPLTLVFMPKLFQHGAEDFDSRFLFTGPCLPVGRPRQNMFAGDTPGLTRNIFISRGTLRNDDIDFYKMCLASFGGGDWRAVMSVGRKIDLAALAPVPRNFHVASHVAQLNVLSEADVFVSHGGLNSTMESLFYGVPLVVIPSIREQRLTARRVRDLGLGLTLARDGLTGEALRQAALAAASDLGIRSRVREMRQIVRESGGTQQAAAALFDYV
jgi:MGT family glycosyltransferase